jgi:hypothetical protein
MPGWAYGAQQRSIVLTAKLIAGQRAALTKSTGSKGQKRMGLPPSLAALARSQRVQLRRLLHKTVAERPPQAHRGLAKLGVLQSTLKSF